LDKHSSWQQEDLKQNVAQKIRFTQFTHCIPDSRVYNIDETSCRILLVGDVCWGIVKAPCRSIGDARVQCTVALATPMLQGDVYAQILYAGLTDRVLPMGPHPRGIFVDHTHNHWQTVQSLKAFLLYLDSCVNSNDPRQPWACLLGAALAPRVC
jgi:hypothetical protein